jgi:hypothetical protein
MEIPDDAVLLRHVHMDQWLLNEQRASSAAFKDRRLSVNLKGLRGVDETRPESSGAIVSLVLGNAENWGRKWSTRPFRSTNRWVRIQHMRK